MLTIKIKRLCDTLIQAEIVSIVPWEWNLKVMYIIDRVKSHTSGSSVFEKPV